MRFDILFLNSLSPPPLPMEVCNSKMWTFKKVFMSTDKNGFSDVNLIVYIDMYIWRLLFKFTLTFSEKLKILRLFTRTNISTLVCSSLKKGRDQLDDFCKCEERPSLVIFRSMIKKLFKLRAHYKPEIQNCTGNRWMLNPGSNYKPSI